MDSNNTTPRSKHPVFGASSHEHTVDRKPLLSELSFTVGSDVEVPNMHSETEPHSETSLFATLVEQYVRNFEEPKPKRDGSCSASEISERAIADSSGIGDVVHTSGLNGQVCKTLNKDIRGVKDFGNIKIRRTYEIFLTLEATTKDDAERLFECLKEVHVQEKTMLLTRFTTDGIPHPRYVHVYVRADMPVSPDIFKELVEKKSGSKCVEVKRIINKKTLLKSMMPNGCSLVLTHNFPGDVLKKVKRSVHVKNKIQAKVQTGEKVKKRSTTVRDMLNKAKQRSANVMNRKQTKSDSGETLKKNVATATIPEVDEIEVQTEKDEVNPLEETKLRLEADVLSLEQSLRKKRDELEKYTVLWNRLNTLSQEKKEILEECRKVSATLQN